MPAAFAIPHACCTSVLPPSLKGSVASFRLRRFVVWSLPLTHVAKEERDDGDQLQRGPFPSRHYADGCPLVCRLPLEHAPRRRTHARTRGPRGSLDHQPVGGQIQPAPGGSLSPPQATGVGQLAHGRNLYQGQRPVVLPLSRRG